MPLSDHAQLLRDIDTLTIQDNPQAKQQLREIITNAWKYLSEKEDITDWQTIKIAHAIAAYKIDWLDLSRCALLSIFENPKNISEEPTHIKRLEDAAKKIDVAKLIKELQ